MSRRPPDNYLKDEMLDRLARMNIELLSELWIARDRLAMLEGVLESEAVIPEGAVDNFVPDPKANERLEALRDVMVENVIGSYEKYNHSVDSLKALGKRLKDIHER